MSGGGKISCPPWHSLQVGAYGAPRLKAWPWIPAKNSPSALEWQVRRSSVVCGNMKDGTIIARKITAGKPRAKIFIRPESVLPVFLMRDVLGCLHLNIRRLLIVKVF